MASRHVFQVSDLMRDFNKMIGKARSRRLPACVMLAATSCLLWARPGLSSAPDEPGQTGTFELSERFGQIAAQMSELDWDEDARRARSSLDNVWRRNGWTSESDTYARDLACEIAAIPPWEPMKRLRLVSERIAKRYGLADDQAARFQGSIMREIAGVLTRNADVIIPQVRDWMEARINNEPLNAKSIAKLAKVNGPLLNEFWASADLLNKELETMVEPSKRRVFRRDLRSFEKRRRHVDSQMARWAEGKWRPVDWGIQDDKTRTAGALAGREEIAGQDRKRTTVGGSAREMKIPRPLAHEPSTWFAYVLEMKKRFDFDAGQLSTAESIESELRGRAESYMEARAGAFQQVPVGKRATHEIYEPIRLLFQELQDRLDLIPTTTQRDLGTE